MDTKTFYAQFWTRIMTFNVVRICVLLALFSTIFCQSHLTQQDWNLASTINFRELAEYYQNGNTSYRVFKRRIQSWKYFCLRINIPKGNCWILKIGLMGKCEKVPKSDFQSRFSTSKLIRIFLNCFSLNNTNYLLLTFLDNINFQIPLLLKFLTACL